MMEEQSNNEVNARDNCVEEDASPMSLNKEGSQSMNSQNKRKKATSSSDEEKIVTVLEKLFEASGKRMQMVTEATVKGNEDRSDIAKELKKMGFSPLDQIAALKLIWRNHKIYLCSYLWKMISRKCLLSSCLVTMLEDMA